MTTRVCRTADLAPGMVVRVVHEGTPVAVFNVGGEYLAIGDTCSHEEASLSEGEVEDDVVECPKHGARFEIRTGRPITLPATRPVPRFAVRIEGDDIYVERESA